MGGRGQGLVLLVEIDTLHHKHFLEVVKVDMRLCVLEKLAVGFAHSWGFDRPAIYWCGWMISGKDTTAAFFTR